MASCEGHYYETKAANVQSRLGNSYAGGLVEFEEIAHKSLAFSVMPHWQTEVAVAEAATFDWIFAKPQHRKRSWSDFHHWLLDRDSEAPRPARESRR